MEQRSGMSSIVVIVLLAVVLILFFVFGGQRCLGGSGVGGGCMGGGQAIEPPAKELTQANIVSEPMVLENEKIKVRIMPWFLGLRIDQVELIELKDEKKLARLKEWEDSTKFNMRIAADTTGTVPVRLLEPTLYITKMEKPDTIYRKKVMIVNTLDTLTWDKGMDSTAIARLEEKGFQVPSYAGFKIDIPQDGRLSQADTFWAESGDKSRTVLVWRDSLGNENRIALVLDGYEVKVERLDTLGAGGLTFKCYDGLAKTEPHDRTETSLYRLYYGARYEGGLKVKSVKSNYEKKRAKYLKKLSEKKAAKNPCDPGPYSWIGLRNKYFAAILIPQNPVAAQLDTSIQVRADQRIGLSLEVPGENSYSIYFGPQDYFELGKMYKDLRLRRIVEMGGSWYRWLSEGILLIFKLLHDLIGNYGVVIMLFALLIKLIFLPLSRMQHRNMQKMQMLQPKLKELQERFKDDPRRFQQEQQQLFKNHGYSPFGGCLPMLIQLPVFFGLYGVLRNTIALRGAEFVNFFTIPVKKAFDFLFIHIPAGNLTWLTDLSIHDPFYILPVLMGVASVIQSLRTNVNPQQRMMTLLMPIFITVIFLNFPSGLQLYWLFFNILSIIEYTLFRRGSSGGTQWQTKQQTREITSAKSLPKSSRR